jgi:hypothetical protein
VATLSVTGRDVEESAYRIQRDDSTMTWHMLGGAVAPELQATATTRQWDRVPTTRGWSDAQRRGRRHARYNAESAANQLLEAFAVEEGYVVQVERGPYALHDDVARLLVGVIGDGAIGGLD